MHMKPLLGVVALSIATLSYIPYLVSVARGRTRPHAFSWIVWGFLTGLAFAAQVVKGAGAGAWTTGLSAAFCIAIAILAVIRGERSASRTDWIMFAVAMAALPLWYFTDDPLWSVLLVMAIDGLAFAMTIRKAWKLPFEEMPMAYFLYAISLVVSLSALTAYNFVTLAYPIYILSGNASVAAVIWYRRAASAARPSLEIQS
jgi:hypothetical protein